VTIHDDDIYWQYMDVGTAIVVASISTSQQQDEEYPQSLPRGGRMMIGSIGELQG